MSLFLLHKHQLRNRCHTLTLHHTSYVTSVHPPSISLPPPPLPSSSPTTAHHLYHLPPPPQPMCLLALTNLHHTPTLVHSIHTHHFCSYGEIRPPLTFEQMTDHGGNVQLQSIHEHSQPHTHTTTHFKWQGKVQTQAHKQIQTDGNLVGKNLQV